MLPWLFLLLTAVAQAGFQAELSAKALPAGCQQVPLGGIKGIRCDQRSSYILLNESLPEACTANLCLFSNGKPASERLFKKRDFLILKQKSLPAAIDSWVTELAKPGVSTQRTEELLTLVANAQDQICRQSPNRTAADCIIRDSLRQSSRTSAMGQACTKEDVNETTLLISNGRIESQRLGIIPYLHLSLPLKSQLASWKTEISNPQTSEGVKGNLKILVAVAEDQLCRCGGDCQKSYPEFSQQGLHLNELGPSTNTVINPNFENWSNGESFTSEVTKSLWTADHWLVGPGFEGRIKVSKQNAALRVQWLTPAQYGEQGPQSRRFTFLENHSIKNAASLAEEIITYSFLIRSRQPVEIIPILWQAFGINDQIPIIIYGHWPVRATNQWQRVTIRYRLPGVQGRKVTDSSYLGVGLDILSGFSGFVEIAEVKLYRNALPQL